MVHKLFIFLICSFCLSLSIASSPQNIHAAPASILNVTLDKTTVARYDKIEWTFDLSKSYPNPFYYYDASDTRSNNPSDMTWVGQDGVSVDLRLTSPSGKTIVLPGFYYEDYARVSQSNVEVLGKKGNGVWKFRFAPSEIGTYQYFITAQDKDGTGRFPASGTQSFVSTTSTNKGFVRTSPKDSRYMAYDNGQSFIPLGGSKHIWESDSYTYENLFSEYKQNNINLIRIWDQADYAISVEGANPVWLDATTTNQPAQGIVIDSAQAHSGLRAAQPSSKAWYQRLVISEPTRQHKLNAWIKGAASVQVRSLSGSQPGNVITQVTNSGGTTWTQLSTMLTPNTSGLVIYLTGSGLIDDVTFGPTDTSGNISYNIVSDSDMERHFSKDNPGNDPNSNTNLARPLGNYFNQWSSYKFDKIIESARQNDVYIQLCSCSGPWFTWPANPEDPEPWNFSDSWVLKSWQRNFRYRVARWGYSTSVLAWELKNEYGHVTPGTNVYTFSQNYGAYQKATDPYNHMRTASQGSQAYSPNFWSSSAFDLANYHDYMMSSRYSSDLANDETNFIHRFAWCIRDIARNPSASSYCNGLGLGDGTQWISGIPQKPWVWGEIGVGSTVWNEPHPKGSTGDSAKRDLHNIVWAGLFSPLGTVPLDWYANISDSAVKNSMYNDRKVASQFFTNVDYDGGLFTHIMTTPDRPPGYTGETVGATDAKARAFAMRRNDKKAAYVWVQHRDNTWFNSPTIPSAISPTLTIGNLLNQSYKVEIWNTYSGQIMSSQTISPTNGSLSFSVSNLTNDVAVKIESTTGVPTATAGPTSTPLPTATTAPKQGDANGDGKVDGIDYITWLTNYNTSVTGGASKGDFNANGFVDGIDYITWLTNYGT